MEGKSIGVKLNLANKLAKLKYISYHRINIIFEESYEINIAGEDSRICNIYCQLLINEVPTDKNAFYEYVTNHAYKALNALWDLKKWNVNYLLDIYSEIKKTNFEYSMCLFKKKMNTDKKITGELVAEYELNHSRVVFIARNRKSEIVKRILIIEADLNFLLYRIFFKTAFWRNESEYVIENDLKEIYFVCNINNEEVNIEYTPKYNTVEQLKGYVEGLNYRTDNDERYRLLHS